MEKEFIPYEQALALKELGFDKPTFGHCFTDKGEFQHRNLQYDYCFNTDAPKDTFWEKLISAPTFSQAFRFFREKFGLNHEIPYAGRPKKYHAFVQRYIYGNNGDNPSEFSYEEAELECLKKLIEIAKQK